MTKLTNNHFIKLTLLQDIVAQNKLQSNFVYLNRKSRVFILECKKLL